MNRQPCLDDREIATVLAALRQLQITPNHSTGHFADTTPLGSDEIDILCERINTANPPWCLIEAADADGCHQPRFAAEVAAAGVSLERFTAAVYWCADCSCVFVPQIDTDTIYPDRAVHIGMHGDPATDHDCACHTLPYEWHPADGR